MLTLLEILLRKKLFRFCHSFKIQIALEIMCKLKNFWNNLKKNEFFWQLSYSWDIAMAFYKFNIGLLFSSRILKFYIPNNVKALNRVVLRKKVQLHWIYGLYVSPNYIWQDFDLKTRLRLVTLSGKIRLILK